MHIVRNNKQFFTFFLIFGTCPILLSLIQYFYEINSLALAFPWRSSVFITPISSVIILSSWIEKIELDIHKLKIVSFLLLLFTSTFFFIKSHFIKDLNSEFTNTHMIGNVMYTDFIHLFQISGIILLLAMIGAIVLTYRKREGVKTQSYIKQISREREDSVQLKDVEFDKGVKLDD